MNRRQKRMMDKENRKEKKSGRNGRGGGSASASGTSTPTEQPATAVSTGERKRVVAENGKVLIVDSIGNVFLEEESEEGEKQEFLLDIDEIRRPSLRDTVVCKLPVWVYRKTVGRVLGSSKAVEEEEDVPAAELVDEVVEATATTKSSARRRGKRNQRS
jgi:hypothetical protein